MSFIVDNTFTVLRITMTCLVCSGFWTRKKVTCFVANYGFPFGSFMFMAGISIIVQMIDLLQIWGDVALMTGASFLLFTNMALAVKMFNIIWRKEEIRAIIEECDGALRAVDTEWGKNIVKSCNRSSVLTFWIYLCLPYITIFGWATGAEKGELPTRAWYPYNFTTSPGYELTYAHQVAAVGIGAGVNVSIDMVVITLMAQCCCRLRLVATSLRKLGEDMLTNKQEMFGPDQEQAIKGSISVCVKQHQAVLATTGQLQNCFSSSILAQFLVSLVAICVSAYQLAFESRNLIVIVSMATYCVCMMMQVFLYCYQGHELTDESSNVVGAVYESPWYKMSVGLRKNLILVMLRSQRPAKLTAGGFTTLSLNAFMAIIKTSYTLFTVLQTED